MQVGLKTGSQTRTLAPKQMQSTVDALRASLSWKLTAPLRAIGALSLRPSFKFENVLYRLYYSFPGFSPARKRAAVLWLHRHCPR